MGANICHDSQKMEYDDMSQIKISKMMMSSVRQQMNKVDNKQDPHIKSKLVRDRINKLPMSQPAKNRNPVAIEQQIYLPHLKAKYFGQVYEERPNGYGKLYFDNLDYLQGIFVEGRCEKKGRFIKANGSYYQGDIKNTVADGLGKFVDINGYKYEGQWKNNLPNGKGQALYPDKNRYIGEFLNNKRHGKGTLFEGGDIYQGDFKNDNLEGKALFQAQNGQTYDGQWKNNIKHGQGVYKWPNGCVYEGQYINGIRQGNGKMIYENGQQYEGQWVNGVKHGRGIYRSRNQKLQGIWKQGKIFEVIKDSGQK